MKEGGNVKDEESGGVKGEGRRVEVEKTVPQVAAVTMCSCHHRLPSSRYQ